MLKAGSRLLVTQAETSKAATGCAARSVPLVVPCGRDAGGQGGRGAVLVYARIRCLEARLEGRTRWNDCFRRLLHGTVWATGLSCYDANLGWRKHTLSNGRTHEEVRAREMAGSFETDDHGWRPGHIHAGCSQPSRTRKSFRLSRRSDSTV